MQVALVHDWLTGMRGGERVLEALCEIFPDAPIFTLLHVPGSVSPAIERHRIVTSPVAWLPAHATAYRYYLPLFPAAVRAFDLRGYEVVISSSHCVAKGVRVPAGAYHVSYVHTPMRYLWDQYDEYFRKGRSAGFTRIAMRAVRPWLRRWDVTSNAGVHAFVANSRYVAERIRRLYGRDADVVPAPVELGRFAVSREDDGYYLIVSAFAPYKRLDLAIEAFNRLGRPLKVIGAGQDERRLRAGAGPGIDFTGWQSDEEVARAYARCRAVVFPGEEDFGIVPLEAMACGKPVIAYGRGGVLDTIVPVDPTRDDLAPTGVFFDEPSADSLYAAVRRFETLQHRFDPVAIRRHVEQFDRGRFEERMSAYVREGYARFRRQSGRIQA